MTNIHLNDFVRVKYNGEQNKSINKYGVIKQIMPATNEFEKTNYKVEILNLKLANKVLIAKESDLDKLITQRICDTTIKEGQIILTDGDGDSVTGSPVLGKVAHLKEKSTTKFVILQNSRDCGSNDIVEDMEGYKGTWIITKTNKKARVVVLNPTGIKTSLHGVICSHCGRKYAVEHLYQVEAQPVCTNCYRLLYTKCTDCYHDTLLQHISPVTGNTICTHCISKIKACKCTMCDTTILNMHTHILNDKKICQQCFRLLFITCLHCAVLVRKNEAFVADSKYFCKICFEERYILCHRCNQAIRKEDAIPGEEDPDHLYCSSCYERQYGNVIKEYTYTPTLQFKKMDFEHDEYTTPLYLGLELEVQRNESRIKAKGFQTFLKSQELHKFFYLKKDGSIGDGFEIVTHPFTLQSIHRYLKLWKVTKWLRENDFKSEESGECGLHVHMSKEFFDENDIIKLRLFFKKNKLQLQKFSHRKITPAHNDPFFYCHFDEMSDKDMINQKSISDRRWALNLNSSKNTIEIRLFNSTLNSKRITAILQFCDAIAHFVKIHGISSFIYGEKMYKNNSWKRFIDWAREENKYKTMMIYMRGEKLCA